MKIGFIAMSGVRAHNKALTDHGLTLPGFVERSKVIASLPSLGLLTLAGLTPREVDVEYVEVPDLDAVNGVPGEFDAVAISSFSAQIREAYRLADRYRARGTRVILGGLHVSARPAEAAQHADTIVIGEGEPAWPALVADLRRGALKQCYDSRGCDFHLAEAPMPRFDLLEIDRYNRLTVQTQRGCPFRCEFCAASMRIAPTFKVKPVEKVMAEIRRIRERWPHPFIEFADDNTFVNKRHGRELMRALAKEHVRWFTETDISVAEDEELLRMMHDAGCAQVLIGLESPSPAGLDGLEQKANWKSKQRAKYRKAIDRIQGHGITVNGCFILGLDGAGPESFAEVWDFVRDSGLYEIQITVQTAFPGTPLYERLDREGRLLRRDAWELCTLFDVNLKPAGMSVAELESGLLSLAAKIYSDEFTRERREKFFDRRRQNLRDAASIQEAQA
ncbi:MAG: B12-binding domain-containing radical SAM protein [Betaproteobacteria bacterium RIFCSPLOWO2_02_FULL_63_19]|nr:MAG: B12-binding domain-containing radical SAM protein [Betaproteobacteria bacterium RIFCSPLOWO2_02_FULL_63_19]